MPFAESFVTDAIRPHVLGRFADMLVAVEQHPAMLIYLDNELSVGSSSSAGRNRKRGLTENLAVRFWNCTLLASATSLVNGM